MPRVILVRLAGVLLLLYGIAAIPAAWWAYSVTHQAFTSVREFVTTFQRERDAAVGALDDALGLIGGNNASPPASASADPGTSRGSAPGATPTPAPGSGLAQRAQGLRDRLGSLLGGGQPPGSAAQQPGAATQSGGDPLDLLSRLENRLTDSKNRWSRLAAGPLPGNQLDQLELVTNVVLGWLALTGLAGIVFGLSLLVRRIGPAPSMPAAAWAQPYPPQQPYPPPPPYYPPPSLGPGGYQPPPPGHAPPGYPPPGLPPDRR